MKRFTRWLGRNLSTLLLAFILAVVVWVSAVTSADPNQEQTFKIPVEVIGLPSDIELISTPPEFAFVTLMAPRSILDEIIADGSNALQAWIDLSEYQAGTHTIPIQYQVSDRFQPVREVEFSPQETDQVLEALVSITLPIEKEIQGEPTLGYQADTPQWSHDEVIVSGARFHCRSSHIGKGIPQHRRL